MVASNPRGRVHSKAQTLPTSMIQGSSGMVYAIMSPTRFEDPEMVVWVLLCTLGPNMADMAGVMSMGFFFYASRCGERNTLFSHCTIDCGCLFGAVSGCLGLFGVAQGGFWVFGVVWGCFGLCTCFFRVSVNVLNE